MKVLVVHDRREVSEEIQVILLESCPEAQVKCVDDATSARDALADTYFDLLILDLTIPNVSGRDDGGFAIAQGLLEELGASTRLMTPGGVLGITQDASALDRVQNNIGPHLMAIVSEDADGDWRSHLRDRFTYVRNSISSRANAILTRHDYDVLIFTALDKELSPYRDMFEVRNHVRIPGLGEFIFTDRHGAVRRGACYAIGRAGQPSAASEAQGLLCQLRPKLAIMSGFCGGVPKKAELGDILFAELAIDWDYGKWKPTEAASKLYARPEPIPIRNTKIHRIARDIVERGPANMAEIKGRMLELSNQEITKPTLRLVPFASGSAVIGDTDILSSIKELNESVGGVDMESFGFYFAAQHAHAAKPEFICIKSVADDCGPEKDDRLHKACCYASAAIAKTIITDMWDY